MGGGQRQLLATCCDFPALLPTAWLMKLPLMIPPLPLPGPLSGLSLSILSPLSRGYRCRSRCSSRMHYRFSVVRNALFFYRVIGSCYARGYSYRIRPRPFAFSTRRWSISLPPLLSSLLPCRLLPVFFSFPPPSRCVYVCGWVSCVCVCVRSVCCFMRVLLCVSCCARERTFSSKSENGLFSFVYLT